VDIWEVLIRLVALLAAALACGGLAARLGQSPIVGYLVAGVGFGELGRRGFSSDPGALEGLAELGVALLLFSLGLEFSWRRLKQLGANTLLAGVLQVAGTLGLVALIAVAMGAELSAAVTIGAMIALSSTATVLRVIGDRAEGDTPHGRIATAVLLVQDMAVVPLALTVAIMGDPGGGEQSLFVTVGRILGFATLYITALWLILHFVAVRLLGSLAVARNRELTTLLAVVIGLGSTWAAHAVGLSPALGAFMAGLILGGSPFAAQLRAEVASLGTLLLTLFFVSVGMVADPAWILDHLGAVCALTVAIMVVKTTATALAIRVNGFHLGVAVAGGLSLAQVGEFAFVLGRDAGRSGLLDPELAMLVTSSSILSLFLTPYLIALAPRVAAALRAPKLGSPSEKISTDVLIVGFGPAGRAVGHRVVGEGLEGTVIDLNPETRIAAQEAGLHGEVGDALQPEVLAHAGLGTARLVVVTLPALKPSLAVLDQVRRLAPHVRIIARCRHERDRRELELAGAHVIIGDEGEVGEALRDALLVELEQEGAKRATVIRSQTDRGEAARL
jgi:K+:H+ antiporter